VSGLNQIRINLEGIAHVLSDNRLRVPVFQRSYAWEKTHVTELLQDIAAAIKAGATEYFLGSIVVSTEHSGMFEVVDGQQRLATVSVVIAQIRDYFLANGENDRAATLESEFLLKRDLRSQEAVPRLTLNDIDHDFFAKTVLARPNAPTKNAQPSRISHRLLSDACLTASQHLAAAASTSRTPIDVLVDYVEFLSTRAKVILVQVPDQANAFTIFETLNDRGLDLAISDLLKNYLFIARRIACQRFKSLGRPCRVRSQQWTPIRLWSTTYATTGPQSMEPRVNEIFTPSFASARRVSKRQLISPVGSSLGRVTMLPY